MGSNRGCLICIKAGGIGTEGCCHQRRAQAKLARCPGYGLRQPFAKIAEGRVLVQNQKAFARSGPGTAEKQVPCAIP